MIDKRSKKKKVKFGIGDVDGTEFDGNLTMELFKDLSEKQIISKEISDGILSYYYRYKKADVDDKLILLDKIYRLFAESLKGKREDEIKELSEETWKKVSGKLFSFSEPLVELLKKKDFKVVLMSGSIMEMVRILGRQVGVDEKDIIAGRLEIEDGVYTGKVISYIANSDQKIEAIDNYSRDNNLIVDWPRSFAIGNDERDLKILDKVGIKIALNPSSILRKRAKTSGYYIVNQNNVIKTVNNILARRS